MSDAYEGGSADYEEFEVCVLLIEGVGEDAQALVTAGGSERRVQVRAAKIAAETGLSVEQLPGTRVVAVVRGGELERFKPHGG